MTTHTCLWRHRDRGCPTLRHAFQLLMKYPEVQGGSAGAPPTDLERPPSVPGSKSPSSRLGPTATPSSPPEADSHSRGSPDPHILSGRRPRPQRLALGPISDHAHTTRTDAQSPGLPKNPSSRCIARTRLPKPCFLGLLPEPSWPPDAVRRPTGSLPPAPP